MLKKILVLLLCLAMVSVLPATTFAQTDATNYNEIPRSISLDAEYINTTVVDPAYLESLWGVPDEVLSSPTEDLLEYFLQTPFVGQQILSVASTPVVRDVDFSRHEAFQELVSRADLAEILNNYAGDILQGVRRDEISTAGFEKLLIQPQILSRIADLKDLKTKYPNLSTAYSMPTASRAAGDFLGYINNIAYYSEGNISTVNNKSVEISSPARELTAAEKAGFNSKYDHSSITRIATPTAIYNCHSYAWYRYTTTNPYWIMDMTNFLNDDACTTVTASSVQAKDIIVYFSENGFPLHSGVVYSVSSSGIPTIRSKWGQGGVYEHAIRNVPVDYHTSLTSGMVSYAFFRYHDYTNKYTGNNYHSGTRHYYQYADFCDICNKQINTTWTSVVCNGPPCNTIMSLTPVPQIA